MPENHLHAEMITGENVIIANTVIAHQGIHMHSHGSTRRAEELPTLILSAYPRPLPDGLPIEPQYPSPTWASECEFRGVPLFYSSERDAVSINIKPVNPYLDAIRDGGPLHTLSTANPWYDTFHFPTFDVKLVNNTDKTVFFHEAEFRVASSKIDKRAIPAVVGVLGSLNVRFCNLGWSPIKNASLKFAITAIQESDCEAAPLELPEILPHNIFLGDIVSS